MMWTEKKINCGAINTTRYRYFPYLLFKERRVAPGEQLLPLCEGWGEKGGQKLRLRKKKDCWTFKKRLHRTGKNSSISTRLYTCLIITTA